MPLPVAHIHYLRLPARQHVYHQTLVHELEDVRVTLAHSTRLRAPLVIDGGVALEPGSAVVWFTFPGRWHDIGRFHLADGSFTGIYSNILTPPVFEPGEVWRTTDLFLDVWIGPSGEPLVLDRDEFEEAVGSGWVDEATARRALEEVERILEATSAGRWPPAIVREWTLDRATKAAAGGQGPHGGR